MKSKVEEILISELKENPDNPRTINEDKFAKLVKSIKEFPEMLKIRPLIIDTENFVLGGNMRLKALRHLNYEKVPIMRFYKLTDAQKREFVIKDNLSYGDWGWEALANNWDVEKLVDWGLDVPGFVLNGEATEDDYVIPAEIKTDIKQGDIFQIGEHFLMCGDSTSKEDVSKLLDGNCPMLCITDPPYGVEYDADWRNKAIRTDGTTIGAYAIGAVTNDNKSNWFEAFNLFKGDVIYCWHASASASAIQFANDIMKAGFEIKNQIIWAKNNIVIGRGDYHWKHEPCWYAVRKGKNHNWQGSRKESTLWEIDKPLKSDTGHSTQKPIECMARPIRNNSAEGESVYDPFVGSGTTLVAGQQLGRKVYAMEISPEYVQICIDRMKKSFPEIEIKRNGEIYV